MIKFLKRLFRALRLSFQMMGEVFEKEIRNNNDDYDL